MHEEISPPANIPDDSNDSEPSTMMNLENLFMHRCMQYRSMAKTEINI